MKQLRSVSVVGRQVGNAVVLAHGEKAPTDEEWQAILGMFTGVPRPTDLRVLVHTLGAAPGATQRARLNAALQGTTPRIAVLSDSPVARAAGTAISWFQPRFRVFRPTDLSLALDHLEVDRSERRVLETTLDELRAEIARGPR